MAEKKQTSAEKLAAEIARLRLCPGNEAHGYAVRIVELVHKFDADDDDVTAQLAQDDVDVEELLKNDKAIMGGIVSMSKLVTAMHDLMKRHLNATFETVNLGGASGGDKEEISGTGSAGETAREDSDK